MFGIKLRKRNKNNGDVFSSSSVGIFGSLGAFLKNPGSWLKWFKISPRLKAVDKIANDIAAIGITHQDKEGNVFEESPAIALINKPNHLPEFTKQGLIWMTEAHLKLIGESFWIIKKDGLGKPTEIYVIPPTWVKSIPRKDTDTEYLVNTSDGVVTRVPKEDMVYFKKLDIEEPYKRGMGDTVQIGDELQLDEFMTKYQTLLFKNNAMPSVAIGMKGSKKDDRERFATNWSQKYGGLNNAYTPSVYDGDSVNIQFLQHSIKELDFNTSRKNIQDITLEHYGIPKELLGKVENSNRATITQAQIIYEENALKPEVILIQDTLNNQYLPMFNLPGVLLFDEFITKDKEFDQEKAMKGWDNGLYTRNEALNIMGDDHVSSRDGDVYKTKFNDIFVRASSPNETDVILLDDEPEEEFIFIDDSVTDGDKSGKK